MTALRQATSAELKLLRRKLGPRPTPAIPTEDISTVAAKIAAEKPLQKPRPSAPSRPEPAPAEDVKEYTPLLFDDAADLFLMFTPEVTLHPWQVQTLMQLSGRLDPVAGTNELGTPSATNPFLFNFVAANGSGKDKTIIAPFAIWFAATKVKAKVVITSSSHEQLKFQTFKYLVELAETINKFYKAKVFEIIEFHITCRFTGSEIKLIRSDDPGKVEGQHAGFGGEFAVIVNEAKSIGDDIHAALSRYTGWNYWLEISSPGGMAGHFYKRSMSARRVWPQLPELGQVYMRRVTAFECPHIPPSSIRLKAQEHGTNSPLYKSSVLAEFSLADELTLIAPTDLVYPRPAVRSFNLPRKAGLDIGLGGDETVLDVWENNQRVGIEAFSVSDQAKLHHRLIALFQRYKLEPGNIIADYGGIGRPIVQRLRECGWGIKAINNEAPALNKKDFVNRGAENWCRVKRLIEEGYLILPSLLHGANEEDVKLFAELTMRRYELVNGKIKLESKADMKARGLGSPNRADAFALVWADVPILAFFEGPGAPAPIQPLAGSELLRAYEENQWRMPRQVKFEGRYSANPHSKYRELLSN